MTISQGDMLPDSTLLTFTEDGPDKQSLSALTAGKKIVLFGLPGAYTGTCTSAHVPSFIRTKDALNAKGIDEVICVSVNDPFVMSAWGKETGATEAGIHMLADGDGSFTKEIGLDFTVPDIGFHGRSKRYAMIVENGKVTHLNIDENAGECNLSAGETILDALS